MLSFDISNKHYEMYKLESQILKTSLYLSFQLLFEQVVKKKPSLESYESSKSLFRDYHFAIHTEHHFILSFHLLHYTTS